jgi:hypothetical protein
MTFEYRDADGDSLTVAPVVDSGERVVGLAVETAGGLCAVHILLDRVEEVVAGIRDAARQASGQQPDTAQHVHKLGNADDDGLMDDWDNCRDPKCPGPTPAAGLSDTQPTNDRAAVLREAADAQDADMERFFAEWPDEPRNSPYVNGRKDAAAELRRMADEETSR